MYTAALCPAAMASIAVPMRTTASPPANTPGRLVSMVSGSTAIVPRRVSLQAAAGPHVVQVRRLAHGQYQHVAIEDVLGAGNGIELQDPLLIEPHRAKAQALHAGGASAVEDHASERARRMDGNSFLLRLLYLLRESRHFLPGLRTGNVHFFGAQPERGAGAIEGHIAAAEHQDLTADRHLPAPC